MQAQKSTMSRRQEAFHHVLKTMDGRRGMGVPVRDVFFSNDEPTAGLSHPIAALMNGKKGSGGGRGGKLRLSLYLHLLWVAAGKTHGSSRPASFWAELLGLEDPLDQGARRIRAAWKDLQDRKFVLILPANTPGDNDEIRPLREDGSGRPYSIPTGYDGDTYRRIPEIALRKLFGDPELTGSGLVAYLALRVLSLKVSRHEDLVLGKEYFSKEVGMGDTTRKKGLENLEFLGVVESHLEKIDGSGEKFDTRGRRRRIYTLVEEYFPNVTYAE